MRIGRNQRAIIAILEARAPDSACFEDIQNNRAWSIDRHDLMRSLNKLISYGVVRRRWQLGFRYSLVPGWDK